MQIIPPHRNKSRECTLEDIPKIKELAPEMIKLCSTKRGLYKGAYALAHSQVEEKDPMRFFVTQEGNVFINPRIINHTHYLVDSEEACMSYADKEIITVQRYNKLVVSCDNVDPAKTATVLPLDGRLAKIFQHEIDHFDGRYIYDN